MKRETLWTQGSTLTALALICLVACSVRPISPDSPRGVSGTADNGVETRDVISAGTPNFDWPVDDARFTRGYFKGTRKPHFGIDLAGPKNTPILAAQHGVVIYTGRDFRGFGKMVIIESGFGWATFYAHLNKILVKEGQKVTQGDVIGNMGRTGRATGVHLHFEVRKNRVPVDPLVYLPSGKEMVEKVADNQHGLKPRKYRN